jgi:hypothetical protein
MLNNIKRTLNFLLVSLFLVSCGMHPKNFTYTCNQENTGLDQLIELNGYYNIFDLSDNDEKKIKLIC